MLHLFIHCFNYAFGMPVTILGISAFYHDSAAVIIIDGEIIAAAEEERFTRKKHDSTFPANAVKYVLGEAGISIKDVDAVSFYEKPFIKFERLLETYHSFVPAGLPGFITSIPVWIKEKLFIKKLIKKELNFPGNYHIPVLFPEHHLSHSAVAFYPSPFEEAAILTIDGAGEWATTTIGHGKGNDIEILKELHFPHSVGLLYSAFTYYTGFTVNSGEYKLMGLAPYGNPESVQAGEYREKILNEIVDIREDGSILLNMKYFKFATGMKMTNDKKWIELFGLKPRKAESEILTEHTNLALAIQQVTEEIILKLAKTAKYLTKCDYLVMAGGVALNSVANGKILNSGIFKDIWIQPASGDSGGALGAALLANYIWKGEKRKINKNPDAMKGALLGPEFSEKHISCVIRKYNAKAKYYNDFNELITFVAQKISEGNVTGWFQGRMEFGPRALGNRSILGDARKPDMQKKMNLKIKHREGFRPFAPAVTEEDIQEYFVIDRPSPYMLFVVPVKAERLKTIPEDYNEMSLYERLYLQRSDIPTITHIDNSARIQSVNKEINFRFWSLINEFKKQTGYGILVNTSFNVRGEPIVCNPDEASVVLCRQKWISL